MGIAIVKWSIDRTPARMARIMEDEIILWTTNRKNIPPRPEYPELYPESDERHWYDYEYFGWNARRSSLHCTPVDGPAGKRIICLRHCQGHPYMTDYDRGMLREAERYGISLKLFDCGWESEHENELVGKAIREQPDLIIFVPENAKEATGLYRRISEAAIPVIGSNLVPEEEAFKYLLSWTGPDDWDQQRMLTRKFAEFMHYEGGYCIVGHMPGSSAYYSRKWAIITELNKIAPKMKLLDMQTTLLNTAKSRTTVFEWLDRFGDELKGIYCADDAFPQMGINQALAERGREDVIRVACGSSVMGLRFVQEGSLKAITYQPPELDGALPIQVAVDWFNGLTIEPLRYLPNYIITAENIKDFLLMRPASQDIDLDSFYRMVSECDVRGIDSFFTVTYNLFLREKIVSVEYFRGFSIELLSGLIAIARSQGIPIDTLCGNYELLFKSLFLQQTVGNTLAWLKQVANQIVGTLLKGRQGCVSLGDQLVHYVDEHYREPLCLKMLSARFGMSAAYLGKVFRERTGMTFASYLNEYRIKVACRIIASRKVKAKDVALAVGYTEPNYFYNIFRKVTGQYPSQYQEHCSLPDDPGTPAVPAADRFPVANP